MRPRGNLKKRTIAVLLAIAFFTTPSGRSEEKGTAAADHQAGLWQKAMDLFQKNSAYYPQKINVLSEVLDRHEQPSSVTELVFALRLDDAGRLQTELTKALKNGKDISKEMRKKVEIRNPDDDDNAPRKKDAVTVSLSDSPFNPERQGAVSYHAKNERRALFGRRCLRYDFTYRTEIIRRGKTEKLTWTGMAWLEEGSGIPVKLEFSLAPLPARIRSLWTIYTYGISQPDRWVLNQIAISGTGGFLFIKKRFRSTTIFSDYSRPPAKEATK